VHRSLGLVKGDADAARGRLGEDLDLHVQFRVVHSQAKHPNVALRIAAVLVGTSDLVPGSEGHDPILGVSRHHAEPSEHVEVDLAADEVKPLLRGLLHEMQEKNHLVPSGHPTSIRYHMITQSDACDKPKARSFGQPQAGRRLRLRRAIKTCVMLSLSLSRGGSLPSRTC